MTKISSHHVTFRPFAEIFLFFFFSLCLSFFLEATLPTFDSLIWLSLISLLCFKAFFFTFFLCFFFNFPFSFSPRFVHIFKFPYQWSNGNLLFRPLYRIWIPIQPRTQTHTWSQLLGSAPALSLSLSHTEVVISWQTESKTE